jgi:hypothetical protein
MMGPPTNCANRKMTSMARKVEVRLIDDLDDTKADETVQFGLDGTSYEVDLSSKHARELRSALDRYVGVARRAAHGQASPARRPGTAAAGGTAAVKQNQAIREWAQGQGLAIALRGRIPQSIVEQYESKAGKAPAPVKRRKS